MPHASSPRRPKPLVIEALEPRDVPAVGAELFADIVPGSAGSFPGELTSTGNQLFFTTNGGNDAFQLFRTDGTSAGTRLVRDINPTGSDLAFNLTNVGGILFFTATDGSNGSELWRSDGTSAGTFMVADIDPGSGSSFPSGLVNVNGALFFTATTAATGNELYRSDGTSAGTQLVRDLNPGSASSFPSDLVNVNGVVFFAADQGNTGNELFRSDGTSAGTFLVKDIDPGFFTNGSTSFFSSFPDELTNINGTLFFTADDGANGNEVWKSDGTSAGTVMVKDVNPGSGGFFGDVFFNGNGTLFFSAFDGVTGEELWKSDGTSAGTVLVRDINPGLGSGFPGSSEPGSEFSPFAEVNGTVFFYANDGSTGLELWRTDGTSSGTVLVRDINPGSGGSVFSVDGVQLFNANGVLIFPADDGSNGTELWSSDGTSAGTRLAADIFPGVTSSSPSGFELFNGVAYFAADNGTLGRELWRTTSGEIRGTVFNDANANGTREGNEAGFAGVTVFLDNNGNGTLDAGDDSTTSAADGSYVFDRLPARSFTVRAVAPSGFQQTAPPSGSFTVTLTQTQVATGVDFGFAVPNRAPTDITLSNNTVPENAPGAVIGTLAAVDPDAGQTHTFSVSDARFEVIGNQLKLRDGVALDFEATPSVTLNITATDSGFPPQSFTKAFTIQVQDVNEAPTAIALSNNTVPEDARGAVVGTLTVTDPDRGQTHTFTVSDPRFEVVGNQLKLKQGQFLDFENERQVTLSVTATDSGSPSLSFTQSFTILIQDVNDTSRLGAYRFQTDGAWSLDSNGNGLYDPGIDTIYTSYGLPGGARTTGEQNTFRLTVPLTTDIFNSGVTRTEPISVPIVGDWNNDGFDEVGFFRDGIWHFDVNNNGVDDAGDVTASFGGAGDQPVVGRFFGANNPSPFGNGIIIGIFTTRIDGLPRFVLDGNGNFQIDPGEETAPYGVATDDVVYGDWTGDGRTKFGVFRADPQNPDVGVFSLDLNGNLFFDGPGESFTFGAGTDGFVVGDWGGNGFDSLAVVREAPDGSGRGYFTLDVNGNRLYDPGLDIVTFFGNATDYFFSGNWHPPATLRALGGPGADPLAPRLDPAALGALVQQGTAAWTARGYDVAPLNGVHFQVANLGDDLLGLASPGVVTLDDDAAGRGWSLAPQPGRIDALSAVMHELGHELGLEDRFDADPFTDVMAAYLPPGVRRAP